jgi:transposase
MVILSAIGILSLGNYITNVPSVYNNRNAIESMFCQLKDFRRVATRYDRNDMTFLAAVCIAAAVSYWL